MIDEIKPIWTEETARAFVNDFFEASFNEYASECQRSTIVFLDEVAKETKKSPLKDFGQYLILLQWLGDQ